MKTPVYDGEGGKISLSRALASRVPPKETLTRHAPLKKKLRKRRREGDPRGGLRRLVAEVRAERRDGLLARNLPTVISMPGVECVERGLRSENALNRVRRSVVV